MGPVCLKCMKEIDYRIEVTPVTTIIRGLNVKYNEWRAVCMECDNEIYDSALSDKNARIRYNAYLRTLRGV